VGNPHHVCALWKNPPSQDLVGKTGLPKGVALYILVVGLNGITVLDGTTNKGRVREDLEGLEAVGMWAEGEGQEEWEGILAAFKEVIGDQ
jgi:hypothetical protein